MTDLYADRSGIGAAGAVADRQAQHLGDVERYVAGVCGRTGAFTGAIWPLQAPYADALASVGDGLHASADAAREWGGAARETAARLAATDALAHQLVQRLGALFPDWFPPAPEVYHPPLAQGPDVAGGRGVTGLPLPGSAPEPGEADLPPGPWRRLTPDLGSHLGAIGGADGTERPSQVPALDHDDRAPWRLGTAGSAGELLGTSAAMAKDLGDIADGVRGLSDTLDGIDDTRDDLDRYDDFVGSAR